MVAEQHSLGVLNQVVYKKQMFMNKFAMYMKKQGHTSPVFPTVAILNLRIEVARRRNPSTIASEILHDDRVPLHLSLSVSLRSVSVRNPLALEDHEVVDFPLMSSKYTGASCALGSEKWFDVLHHHVLADDPLQNHNDDIPFP